MWAEKDLKALADKSERMGYKIGIFLVDGIVLFISIFIGFLPVWVLMLAAHVRIFYGLLESVFGLGVGFYVFATTQFFLLIWFVRAIHRAFFESNCIG